MTLDEWFDNNEIIRDAFLVDYYDKWKIIYTTVLHVDPSKNIFYHKPQEWLKENVGKEYINWQFAGGGYWLFDTEEHALLFKLVWG